MIECAELNEEKLEEMKKELQIDEKIADRYDVPLRKVRQDFDKRLVRLLLEAWRKMR